MTATRASADHEPRPVSGKWRAAALYALLTVLLTFPLSVTADRRLPGAGVAVGALLLLEFTVVPFAGVPYQVEIPAADRWLARKDERFSVVEVPITQTGRYHSTYMLHSMAHWQKTVNGYSGIRPRLHDRLYEYLETFPNEESLRELARLDVTYLVVHLSWFPPGNQRSVEQRLSAFDSWLTLEYSDPESRVYSIHWPAGVADGFNAAPRN